jgi:hypothetical protein
MRRMGLTCRLFSAFLLFCVVLALGDAPYVDEFLDDLAAARAAALDPPPASPHHRRAPTRSKGTTGSSRLCQNLLNLYVAPRCIQLSRAENPGRFVDTLDASFSSTSPRRIDRPPAPSAA